MGGEVEHLLLALAAGVEVAVGHHHLVAQGLGLRHDHPVRIDDHRAADQPGAVLVAGLGHAHRPGRVHVGIGLRRQVGVEGADLLVLGAAAIRVIGGGVVADQHQFHALQPIGTPGFRPAAVVADQHAHHRPAPGLRTPEGLETLVAVFEVALLQLLEAVPHTRLHRTGQVHLAVPGQDAAIGAGGDGAVEAPPFRCALGIADIEANTQRLRAVEERLHRGVGHGCLVVLVELCPLQQPAGEEGGEGQFGEDHELRPLACRLFQQRDQAGQHRFPAVRALGGSHLGGSEAEETGHGGNLIGRKRSDHAKRFWAAQGPMPWNNCRSYIVCL